MNAQQAENLRILIRHMERDVKRVLNMEMVCNPCGTPACALGEACFVPALVAQGLSASPLSPTGRVQLRGEMRMYDSAARDIFGLDANFAERLFSTGGSEMLLGRSTLGEIGRNAWNRNDVTPQEWALEARKVLAEHGYSMDTDAEWADAKVRELAALPRVLLTAN